MSTLLLLGSGEFELWSTDVERLALAGADGDGSVESAHRKRLRGRCGVRSMGHHGARPLRRRGCDRGGPTCQGARGCLPRRCGRPPRPRLDDLFLRKGSRASSPTCCAIRRCWRRSDDRSTAARSTPGAARARWSPAASATPRVAAARRGCSGSDSCRTSRSASMGSRGPHPRRAVVAHLTPAGGHLVRRDRRAHGDPRGWRRVDGSRVQRRDDPPRRGAGRPRPRSFVTA